MHTLKHDLPCNVSPQVTFFKTVSLLENGMLINNVAFNADVGELGSVSGYT